MKNMSNYFVFSVVFNLAVVLTGCGDTGEDAVVMPEDYRVLVFGNPSAESGLTLRFSQNAFPDEDVIPDLGERFVKAKAEKNGVEVKIVGDKFIYLDVDFANNNNDIGQMTYWQIGIQDMVVIMSAEIDPEKRDQPWRAPQHMLHLL